MTEYLLVVGGIEPRQYERALRDLDADGFDPVVLTVAEAEWQLINVLPHVTAYKSLQDRTAQSTSSSPAPLPERVSAILDTCHVPVAPGSMFLVPLREVTLSELDPNRHAAQHIARTYLEHGGSKVAAVVTTQALWYQRSTQYWWKPVLADAYYYQLWESGYLGRS